MPVLQAVALALLLSVIFRFRSHVLEQIPIVAHMMEIVNVSKNAQVLDANANQAESNLAAQPDDENWKKDNVAEQCTEPEQDPEDVAHLSAKRAEKDSLELVR